MKRIIQRTAAMVLGLMLGAVAFAGLETVTHISDLNSSWPLGSDLASTSDDHIRNIKVALKTDFPNVNAAVTPTPTQFNQLTTDTFTNVAVSSSTIPTNGIYLPSANTLGFAVNTGAVGSMTSTVMTMPAFAVTGATLPTNGIYLPSANAMAFATNSSGRGSIDSSGAWSITAPSAGTTAFTVNGSGSSAITTAFNSAASTNLLLQLKTNGTTRGYVGAAAATDGVIAGTVAGDLAFRGESTVNLLFSADGGTTAEMKITGTPAIQGRGPVAAALVDMTPDKGTFTGTLTGFTANPTGTVTWVRMGNIVSVYITSSITATSNAGTMTMTGLPSAIQPASTQVVMCAQLEDNTVQPLVGKASITAGTITFQTQTVAVGQFNTFTASGTKGLIAGWSITYPIG
jgi:hypothetical protein